MGKSFRGDFHVHSYKSFDADQNFTVKDILASASARELNQIALTDHYDINFVLSGENDDIDFAETKKEIDAAKAEIQTDTEFLLGIELGQPNQFPEKANKTLEENNFDYVLCSLHNARNEQDFYFIDYKNCDILHLIDIFGRYTTELLELAEWGNFHTLAHITYPIRYFVVNNIHIPMAKYEDIYRELFKILMRRGIALEVNTSGLRKRINATSPSFDLLKIYKEMGGELIILGSDAHNTSDVYSGVQFASDHLKDIGFKYICGIKDKKLYPQKLE
ncbi:histidinol phosphate phosphatase [Clostridia bacterium]|nr:histidinol phosphate phosphatase [Clostridia bacterium]